MQEEINCNCLHSLDQQSIAEECERRITIASRRVETKRRRSKAIKIKSICFMITHSWVIPRVIRLGMLIPRGFIDRIE